MMPTIINMKIATIISAALARATRQNARKTLRKTCEPCRFDGTVDLRRTLGLRDASDQHLRLLQHFERDQYFEAAALMCRHLKRVPRTQAKKQ
jgi:DNA-binding GntR family transcriptional regulator